MSSKLEELTKIATESISYDMDFSSRLSTGDTISTLTAVTFTNQNRITGSTDISIGSTGFNTTHAQVRLIAGQQYEQYIITITVGTTLGNTLIGEGLLRIE